MNRVGADYCGDFSEKWLREQAEQEVRYARENLARSARFAELKPHISALAKALSDMQRKRSALCKKIESSGKLIETALQKAPPAGPNCDLFKAQFLNLRRSWMVASSLEDELRTEAVNFVDKDQEGILNHRRAIQDLRKKAKLSEQDAMPLFHEMFAVWASGIPGFLMKKFVNGLSAERRQMELDAARIDQAAQKIQDLETECRNNAVVPTAN